MAWAGVHEEVVGPKLRSLAKDLGCSESEALGLLTLFWLWGLRNADKYGFLINADEEDAEEPFVRKTKLPPSLIVAAMFETGWIDKVDGRIQIHDWETWQEPWYKAQEKREADKTRKQEEKKAINKQIESNEYAADFEQFWSSYPRHVDKQAAFKCYCTKRKCGWSAEQILEATNKYAAQCKHDGTQQTYIKHPKTFLGPNEPFVEFIERKVKEPEKVLDLSDPFKEYAEVS